MAIQLPMLKLFPHLNAIIAQLNNAPCSVRKLRKLAVCVPETCCSRAHVEANQRSGICLGTFAKLHTLKPHIHFPDALLECCHDACMVFHTRCPPALHAAIHDYLCPTRWRLLRANLKSNCNIGKGRINCSHLDLGPRCPDLI